MRAIFTEIGEQSYYGMAENMLVIMTENILNVEKRCHDREHTWCVLTACVAARMTHGEGKEKEFNVLRC